MRAEDGPTQAPLTEVRPGHADLAGMQKYGFTDARDVLERASARETAARVAAGSRGQGAAGRARRRHREPRHPDGRGPLEGGHPARPGRPAAGRRVRRCAASTPPPRRRWSPRSRRRPRTATASAASSRCWPTACPVGLGSHVHWDRKLDALLARALMSIQAVKGVEIGDGFEVAGRRGSDAHDPITWDASSGTYRRESALAGGIEGGISTGEVLVARAAMKPLATLNRPTLRTVDTATKEETVSLQGAHRRHRRAGDGRGGRDDGGARARRRGHPQVRRRLRRGAVPQPRRLRGDAARPWRSTSCSWGSWAPARPRSAVAWPPGSTATSSTPTPPSRRSPTARSPRSSSRTASRASATSRPTRSRSCSSTTSPA